MAFRSKNIFIVIVTILILNSCTDIMDPDISAKKPELLSPADNLRSILSTHTFWWEEMEYAESYNLQIAKPDFPNIEQVLLDTIISTNKFVFGLEPGPYQWRVKALNTRSESGFVTRSLIIDPTLDISGETLQLHSPTENDTTNLEEIIFKWIKLYNAEQYFLELEYDGSIIKSRSTENDTVIIPITWGDGDYKWHVRATNPSAQTDWFHRSFFYDTEAPDKPVLSQPGEAEVLNDDWNDFVWTHDNNDASSIADSLIIIKDGDPVEIIRALLLSKPIHSDSLGVGSFRWYVRSVDKAGNLSEKSEIKTFIIQ